MLIELFIANFHFLTKNCILFCVRKLLKIFVKETSEKRTIARNSHYLVPFENHTSIVPGIALIETALTGDPLCKYHTISKKVNHIVHFYNTALLFLLKLTFLFSMVIFNYTYHTILKTWPVTFISTGPIIGT